MKISKILISPCCQEKLLKKKTSFTCSKCGENFQVKNKKIFLIKEQKNDYYQKVINERDETLFKFEKNSFFSFIKPPSETLRIVNKENELVNKLSKNSLILNFGPDKRFSPQQVNFDVNPSGDIDIVGEAENLPFKKSSFELVICRFLLEHVAHPGKVIREIKRVLKKNGLIYVDVPFMIPFHPSPSDYNRFTIKGLKELMKPFEEVETGISAGPASSLSWILKEFPGLIWNNKIFFRASKFVFGWLFFPLKYLDYFLVKRKNAFQQASAFYFIGRKV